MEKLLQKIDLLKKEIDAKRPLNQSDLDQIKEYYRIGLTYSSNALEGNSLTESETKIVLEEGITIGGKRLVDHLEAIGHSDAYNFMLQKSRSTTFDEADIQRLHHLFYSHIDEAQAGTYRTIKVYLTGSHYPLPNPQLIPELMKELINNSHTLRSQLHPVLFAAKMHQEFVFIHPFVDGNGRVARLLMNLILLQTGYNIAIIPPIMRSAYIAALEKAHTDNSDFLELIARMVYESQNDYIRLFLS